MTREEFERDVRDMDDLKSFCWDNDCYECDEVESSDVWNDWIEENLVDWARDNTWRDLMSILNNMDDNSGYSWYVWDEYTSEYRPADDSDFEEYHRRVLEWADENGVFDDAEREEEDEDENFEPVDPEDEEPTPDEECSFDDIYKDAIGCVRRINEEILERARQEDKMYAEIEEDVLPF